MWFCSQWLIRLPFELQFPSVSLKPLNSHFFLSACFHLLLCHSYAVKVYFIFLAEVLGKVVVENLFCSGFLLEVPRYVMCWITSSVYTVLMTLHSCHFIYAFELFKSGAPGWKQKEVAVWVFSQINVMCLLLQLYPQHFLVEYLAQGCSAGFGFVKHLLRKSADYWRPWEYSSPLMLAFENAGLTLIQQSWSSVRKCSKCKF